jgi:transcriptional regulator with XRE-family HTH domain
MNTKVNFVYYICGFLFVNKMEERIRKFMEYKGLSASELADSIGVQRSNVSHVLKNRNKPSFQFIEKMLQVYPELNAKWLLLGVENMIENSSSKEKTLFDQVSEPAPKPAPLAQAQLRETVKEGIAPESLKSEEFKEPKPIQPLSEKKGSDNSTSDQFFTQEKPIERLIVFFNDQTFKVYYPSL